VQKDFPFGILDAGVHGSGVDINHQAQYTLCIFRGG
jgi:hypothetical protein